MGDVQLNGLRCRERALRSADGLHRIPRFRVIRFRIDFGRKRRRVPQNNPGQLDSEATAYTGGRRVS